MVTRLSFSFQIFLCSDSIWGGGRVYIWNGFINFGKIIFPSNLETRLLEDINNLRYADETTLMTESEEELKSLLMKVKEESEKAGLKTQHSEN